ncbi:hypothetical protein [Actinomadura hibisca]|uniref:hypothetical protein n=1 Tax=Actinomadura hibisca TaxID=68565 RepID=UPI00082CE79A|nr:hypothetical protein [Actinomadura hibisca]
MNRRSATGAAFAVVGGLDDDLFGPAPRDECQRWITESADVRQMLAQLPVPAPRTKGVTAPGHHQDDVVEFVRLGMTFSLEFAVQVTREETFARCLLHMAYGSMRPVHTIGLLLPFFRQAAHVEIGRLVEPFVTMHFAIATPDRQRVCAELVEAAWRSKADIVGVRHLTPLGSRTDRYTYLRRGSTSVGDAPITVRMKWDG